MPRVSFNRLVQIWPKAGRINVIVIVLQALIVLQAKGALPSEVGTILLPLNCSELLADHTPFSQFFEAVARGLAGSDRQFSKRLFRILALRDKLANENAWVRDQNPIDAVIRKSLCFFREQKESTRPIPFDYQPLTSYLKNSMKDIEPKVEKVILQVEYERRERRAYEEKLARNSKKVEGLRREATKDANQMYQRLSVQAQKRVKIH